jgi:cytochrome c biogenesis factor
MEFEVTLLILSAVFVLFDLFQLSRRKSQRKTNLGLYGAALGFLLILTAYLLLLQGFATDNFSMTEVYTYSSSSQSLASKLCASWAGAGGSILFLTLLISAVYFAVRLKMGNKASPTNIGASQVLSIFVIFFIIMDIGKNPFTRMPITPFDGAGLNPALQTPWMMVHPPIVFAGYAFVLLAFALTLGGIKSREFTEGRLLKASAGVAWLFMTVGIAIGGLWAYEVLGWGGYWSWDPVEVGSLLVWLGLTANFFARLLPRSSGGLLKQFTLLVTFAALIFLSALTRGGLLQSVHAYALSPAGPILIGLGVGFTLYFFYLKRKVAAPLLGLAVDKSSLRQVCAALGLFSVAALFVVSFFGVTLPIVGQLFTPNPWTPNSAFYNTWSFPFASLLVLAITGFSLQDKIHPKTFAVLAAVAIAAGVALAAAGWPTPDSLANIGVPLLALSLGSVSYGLAATALGGQRTFGALGRKLLFLGMIIGLFGIMFSAVSKQTVSVADAAIGNDCVVSARALDANVTLRDWAVYAGQGQVLSSQMGSVASEYSSLKLTMDVSQGGTVYSDVVWAFLYTNYGSVVKPLVLHTPQGDYYIHLNMTDQLYNSLFQALMGVGVLPTQVSFSVSTVPMIYLLWAGVVIMCVGIALQIVDETRTHEQENKPDTSHETKPRLVIAKLLQHSF